MGNAEILAPVGGSEQLIAAVRSGADAVYLGTKLFNARRNADNFGDSLEAAVKYCHGRGVKVHVTVNTLIMDAERDSLIHEAERIARSGADAVIIQDLAVARIFRECCPEMPMHASTQLTVHNLSGALMAKDLGFSRVVPARELSLEEIREIAKSGLEIECFVHGALCMCLSGACYLSSMLGGRSGNRGLCAQPCRLDFRSGGRHYALSLKDMSYIDKINALLDVGVCSFKIEGRMKRPEYVAAAVYACRDALAGRQPDMDTLRAVFSRSGFTDGYLTGRRTLDMFGHRTKEDVQNSAAVMSSLAGLYRAERMSVPVDMTLSLNSGVPAELSVSDGENTVSVTGAVPQAAMTRPTDRENAGRNLGKTGGTPFFLRDLALENAGSLALPPSEINALRRDALEKLLSLRETPVEKAFSPTEPEPLPSRDLPSKAALRLRFESSRQIPENSGDHVIILPIEEIAAHPDLLTRFGGRLWGEMPAAVFPAAEPGVKKTLEKLRNVGFKDIYAGNIGTVRMALDAGFTVHGGHGLNILNSFSLEELRRLGLADGTLSFELNMNAARGIAGTLPRGIIAYGYLPLMTMRACPAQSKGGCGKCGGVSQLTDRMGIDFPLICHRRHYVTLLNSRPLHMAEKLPSGFDFMTLFFTTETKDQCREIIADYTLGRAFSGERTKGLYYRELR